MSQNCWLSFIIVIYNQKTGNKCLISSGQRFLAFLLPTIWLIQMKFFLGNKWKQLLKQVFLDKVINVLSNFKTKATQGSWALLIKGKWNKKDPWYQGCHSSLPKEQKDSEFSFLILIPKSRFALQIFEVEGLSNQLMGWLCQDNKGFCFSWMMKGEIIF